MNTNKFIMGTLAGGITFFLAGFVIYGIALMSFFEAHAGSATGVAKADMVWWALILGNMASAGLLSYIFLKWANISSFGSGASAAAIIGFFMSLSYEMINFATTNVMDMTGAIAEVIVSVVYFAIGGGVIGAVLGIGKKS
jgi:hypothetical protein